jgi:hypothetical protein
VRFHELGRLQRDARLAMLAGTRELACFGEQLIALTARFTMQTEDGL